MFERDRKRYTKCRAIHWVRIRKPKHAVLCCYALDISCLDFSLFWLGANCVYHSMNQWNFLLVLLPLLWIDHVFFACSRSCRVPFSTFILCSEWEIISVCSFYWDIIRQNLFELSLHMQLDYRLHLLSPDWSIRLNDCELSKKSVLNTHCDTQTTHTIAAPVQCGTEILVQLGVSNRIDFKFLHMVWLL